MIWNVPDTKTLTRSLSKAGQVVVERVVLLSSSDPALGFVLERVLEDFGVGVDEVCGLADWGLENESAIMNFERPAWAIYLWWNGVVLVLQSLLHEDAGKTGERSVRETDGLFYDTSLGFDY